MCTSTHQESPKLFNIFTDHLESSILVNAEIELINIKFKMPDDLDLTIINNLTNVIHRAAW